MAYHQTEAFEAGTLFARLEGIVPVPESAHAVKAAIDEALKASKSGEKVTMLFNLSGHGLLDLVGYEEYLTGRMRGHKAQNIAINSEIIRRPLLFP